MKLLVSVGETLRGEVPLVLLWLAGWQESMAGASAPLGTTENLGRIHCSCGK